jgi:hypothetical protein
VCSFRDAHQVETLCAHKLTPHPSCKHTPSIKKGILRTGEEPYILPPDAFVDVDSDCTLKAFRRGARGGRVKLSPAELADARRAGNARGGVASGAWATSLCAGALFWVLCALGREARGRGRQQSKTVLRRSTCTLKSPPSSPYPTHQPQINPKHTQTAGNWARAGVHGLPLKGVGLEGGADGKVPRLVWREAGVDGVVVGDEVDITNPAYIDALRAQNAAARAAGAKAGGAAAGAWKDLGLAPQVCGRGGVE